MLNPEDRNAIEGLFSRLSDVERRAEPRDPEAEALIREKIAMQPGAPYYLAQTVLVQEHALSVAERRIEELEREVQQRRQGSGGIFGGLFGEGRQESYGSRAPVERREQPGPWDRDRQESYGNRGGGGFLAGAAQTALGVTGGVLLGSAIASMFGAGGAQAAEADTSADQDQSAEADQGAEQDTGGDDLGGGDFGDGGGFDFGGDF